MTLSILYIDSDYVLIDKPAGMLVHRSRIAQDQVFALQTLRDQIGQRVYPVHRLDRANEVVERDVVAGQVRRHPRGALALVGVGNQLGKQRRVERQYVERQPLAGRPPQPARQQTLHQGTRTGALWTDRHQSPSQVAQVTQRRVAPMEQPQRLVVHAAE